MRTALALLVFLAAPVLAQDDYYARQLQQQQQAARDEANRQEQQRLLQQQQQQAAEREQLLRASERRQADLATQRENDKRWDDQTEQRRRINQSGQEAYVRNQNELLRLSVLAGQRQGGQRTTPVTARCEPLVLRKDLVLDNDASGYFAPEGRDPYISLSFKVGAGGRKGRLNFTIKIKDGDFATEVGSGRVGVELFLNSPERHFVGRAGTTEYWAAELGKVGSLEANISGLKLAETERGLAKKNGTCLWAEEFELDETWEH
jgi:hypothetical protein